MANLYDDFDVSLEHEAVEKVRLWPIGVPPPACAERSPPHAAARGSRGPARSPAAAPGQGACALPPPASASPLLSPGPTPLLPQESAQGETIAVLERNMSALFATARLEVRRKDDEIGRLRKL
jgi:hypothetical protein